MNFPLLAATRNAFTRASLGFKHRWQGDRLMDLVDLGINPHPHPPKKHITYKSNTKPNCKIFKPTLLDENTQG